MYLYVPNSHTTTPIHTTNATQQFLINTTSQSAGKHVFFGPFWLTILIKHERKILLQHILRAKGKWIWTRRQGLAHKTLVQLMLYTSTLIHYIHVTVDVDKRKYKNEQILNSVSWTWGQVNRKMKHVIKALPCHRRLTSIQMWCIPPDLFFCKKPEMGLFSPRGWSSSSLVLPSSTNTV